jgi:hypothetical protein
MSFIKQPSEIEEKKNLVMMVYGEPGQGKTTLALSAPSPVLIDTDGGVGRTLAAHRCPTVQVKSWEDVLGAMDEIAKAPQFQTIVVDTVGKLLDFMSEFIVRNDPKMRKRDGSLSLPGYGQRKNMFRDFVKRCMMMGRNVVFVAHASEEKVGDDYVVRPIVGGSSMNDIMGELDLLGLLVNFGGKRLLLWGNDGTSGFAKSFYSKNTCFLPNTMDIPVVADVNGNAINPNTFLAFVMEQYEKSQKEKEELNQQYGKLTADFTERINAAKSLKDINKLRDEIVDNGFKHIYDSKIVLGKALNAAAKALGLVYSKVDEKYVKDTEVSDKSVSA